MSLIDNLLDGKQVEWKNLGEVGELVRGNGLPKSDFTDTGVPAIHYGEIYKYYGTFTTKTLSFVSPETASKLKKVDTGDVIITNTSENLEDVGKSVVYLGKDPAVTGGHATIFKPSDSIEGKFLAYFTQTSMFQKLKRKYAKGTKVIDISAKDLTKIILPIPPIDVQKEIVKILDAFSKHTADLTALLNAELIARNKQYSYYREQLFNFEKSEAEWKSLDEIGDFQRGKRFVKTDLISEGVPTIHYGEMYTHYGTWADETISFVSEELVKNKNLRVAEKGDVVIVAAGETIEDIGKGTAWLGDEGVIIHDACFSLRSPLNPKYVAYFTRTKQFHDQIRRHISSGKISAINSNGLSKAIIPVPSKEEQERVVSILDKFDILTTSISENLPKEIELRQKQYESYRDALLTFPKNKLEE
jgi:type I restriction enzyme, S subunit